jgi:uncharacterized membrane protein
VAGTGRYEEIDAARGIGILMMILFHSLFDLSFFGVYPVNVATGFWRYFAFATASLFLFVVGISLTISHAREEEKLAGDQSRPFRIAVKYLKRGMGVFACGLLVTLATWLYLGEGFVIFGILHLIGISIMLAPLFFSLHRKNIVAGVLCIAAGIALAASGIHGPISLVWLGIPPVSFTSVDYTPLFPWFGIVLMGMGFGEQWYPEGKRSFAEPDLPASLAGPLALLGRHSLLIYLVHQPVLLVLLQIFSGAPVLG